MEVSYQAARTWKTSSLPRFAVGTEAADATAHICIRNPLLVPFVDGVDLPADYRGPNFWRCQHRQHYTWRRAIQYLSQLSLQYSELLFVHWPVYDDHGRGLREFRRRARFQLQHVPNYFLDAAAQIRFSSGQVFRRHAGVHDPHVGRFHRNHSREIYALD